MYPKSKSPNYPPLQLQTFHNVKILLITSFKEFQEIENANGTQFSANPSNGISLLNRPILELQIGILQNVIGT